jgi:hypothetical protein
LWDRAAAIVARLGSPIWDVAREALADLDEYLLMHRRSFYCLADRVAGKVEPVPITHENIMDIYKPAK